MKINLEEMVSGNTCIHCETEEKSLIFLKAMDAADIKWATGRIASDHTNFEYYESKTVYIARGGILTFTSIEYCELNGYDILEFDDYEWENFVQFDELTMNVEDFMVGLFE